jgi:integrase
VRTSKRGVLVAIPVSGPLKIAIEAAVSHDAITLCANSRGKPWTVSGFRASFFKCIRRLVAEGDIGEGLTFHGLRHSVATDLRELGYDNRTIADLLGQKSEAMAAHYSRNADLSKKLTGVMRELERAHRK